MLAKFFHEISNTDPTPKIITLGSGYSAILLIKVIASKPTRWHAIRTVSLDAYTQVWLVPVIMAQFQRSCNLWLFGVYLDHQKDTLTVFLISKLSG